jgi:hypothetical protein
MQVSDRPTQGMSTSDRTARRVIEATEGEGIIPLALRRQRRLDHLRLVQVFQVAVTDGVDRREVAAIGAGAEAMQHHFIASRHDRLGMAGQRDAVDWGAV